MAEARTDAEKTKQDNLRAEYEREQDTYTNRYQSCYDDNVPECWLSQ